MIILLYWLSSAAGNYAAQEKLHTLLALLSLFYLFSYPPIQANTSTNEYLPFFFSTFSFSREFLSIASLKEIRLTSPKESQ